MFSICFYSQACANGIDAGDEKDRAARELAAATRIQAITRGSSARKNNSGPGKAAANSCPRRRPPHEGGGEEQHKERPLESAVRSADNGTVTESPGAAAPSAATGSGDVRGGAQQVASSAAGTSSSSAAAAAAGAAGGGDGAVVEIDRKTVTLIASLVNDRITVRGGSYTHSSLSTGFHCSAPWQLEGRSVLERIHIYISMLRSSYVALQNLSQTHVSLQTDRDGPLHTRSCNTRGRSFRTTCSPCFACLTRHRTMRLKWGEERRCPWLVASLRMLNLH